MQELDEMQLRSNTKDARSGRNTNASILIATDMHATETMNQQWAASAASLWGVHRLGHRLGHKECPPQGHSLCTRRCSDMEWHISAVDHKTTRLGSLVSSWIDTGVMHKIQWNNTNKIQHKRCKNWTKYKYIDPHSNRYACNRNTESTMRNDIKLYVS